MWRKLMHLVEWEGEVGVVGQRWSGIVSESESESEQSDGAASISSTKVEGVEMECTSSRI
jgi:hypothetical protein